MRRNPTCRQFAQALLPPQNLPKVSGPSFRRPEPRLETANALGNVLGISNDGESSLSQSDGNRGRVELRALCCLGSQPPRPEPSGPLQSAPPTRPWRGPLSLHRKQLHRSMRSNGSRPAEQASAPKTAWADRPTRPEPEAGTWAGGANAESVAQSRGPIQGRPVRNERPQPGGQPPNAGTPTSDAQQSPRLLRSVGNCG